MSLFKLIYFNRQDPGLRRDIVIMSFLAGLVNLAILAIVNTVAQTVGEPSPRMFTFFVGAIPLYVLCARYSSVKVSGAIEAELYTIRLRVAEKARRADLLGVERIGAGEMYDRISENLTTVSQSAGQLATFMQMVATVLFNGLYLASVSTPGILICGTLLSVGIGIFFAKTGDIRRDLEQNAKARLAFFDTLTELLHGSKEVRFSRLRSEDLEKDLRAVAGSLRDSSLRASRLVADNSTFAQCVCYVTLGAAVFVVPRTVEPSPEAIATFVLGILFVFMPLGYVIGCYPASIQANLAMRHIAELEVKIDEAARGVVPRQDEKDPWGGCFESLEARAVELRSAADGEGDGFHVGPVSLTIARGEVVFIVGGNGSGKSTLLRVLLGLYPPCAGALFADGTPVQAENAQAYREMISVVFEDFHLFKKLYGMPGVEDAAVSRLLEQMQIHRKTSFAEQRFTTQDLSTGQRKRLALLVALLEDRPIYAFDAWAADQDPEFRRYFYEALIPDLKRRGKTVLVVTHDDRYFHLADRLVTMEEGRIRSIEGKLGGATGLDPLPAES